MGKLFSFMPREYRRCLEQPLATISVVLIMCAFALYYARDFTFDASADTLIAEGDPELAYFRQMTSRFGESTFLVMTYTPRQGELFSEQHIEHLRQLEKALLGVEGVAAVTSILDAPLLASPPIPITQLAHGYNTLRQGNANLMMAKQELSQSPLFKELLISSDGRSTLLQIKLKGSDTLNNMRRQHDALVHKDYRTREENKRLDGYDRQYRQLKEELKAQQAQLVEQVRRIRDTFSDDAQIYLGGVPMIAADMISFVRSDLSTFSIGIVLLISACLWIFFRRLRWVLIPLGTTFVSILLMVGLLGFLNQPITAISSSFVSLLAIISISFTIHLIVRYRELRLQDPEQRHIDLVFDTMSSKLAPCLYTAITTTVAFASLMTSEILPLVDFGWIMVVGISISLMVTYAFFGSILVLMDKGEASVTLGQRPIITQLFGYLTLHHPGKLLLLAALSILVSAYGISMISLENRFVDYFKAGTEIRDGMIFIDEHLGGTLPLDIIIKLDPFEEILLGEDDPFGPDPFASPEDSPGSSDEFPQVYWFTPDKVHLLERYHQYLDSRPELGKSVSLSNLEQIARGFNDGEALDSLELVAVLSLLPAEAKTSLIDPYASPETGELRISIRIHETGPTFSKSDLIRDIKQFGVEELGIPPENIRVTGMTVLFDNMLSQLFASQTSSFGFVVIATLILFVVLLRSLSLGIIGMVPNILAPMAILGIMGFVGIPLDMMTITIAAIVIGIGVDDAIHFLHRFKEERDSGLSVIDAVMRSHDTIGSALYFTSVTIICGFSVLSLSNFVPTIEFGLLTALAMLLALIGNLTLLPALLVKIYGKEEAI